MRTMVNRARFILGPSSKKVLQKNFSAFRRFVSMHSEYCNVRRARRWWPQTIVYHRRHRHPRCRQPSSSSIMPETYKVAAFLQFTFIINGILYTRTICTPTFRSSNIIFLVCFVKFQFFMH